MDGVTAAGERVDWCHLLPTPADGWDLLVVLGADDRTQRLVESAGVAATVSFDEADIDHADAVAVVGSTRAGLDEIVDRAAPAAAVLAVVRRRVRRARRVLRRAGFDAVAASWPVPGWDRPRRLVPIDHPGALRWYLDHLLVERSLAARAGRAAVARLASLSPGLLAAAIPSVVLVGSRGPIAPGRALVMTSGNDRWSRTVACEFADGGTEPSSVLKAPTGPAGNEVVTAEQQTLRAVRDQLSPAMRNTLPEPLGTSRRGALLVGRESAISGTSMAASSGRDDVAAAEADLDAAASWACRLASETATTDRWDPGRLADWIVGPAVRHHQHFGHDPRLDDLIDALRSVADDLIGHDIPHGWTHHDLGPWNILRRPEGVAVVDWEAARPPDPRSTPPLVDLVYLGTYWLHVADGAHDDAAQRGAARRLWTDASDASASVAAVRSAIGRAVVELGVPPAVVPIAIVHTWLVQANRVVERRTALGLDRPADGIHPQTVLDVLCDDPDGLLAVASAIGDLAAR